MRLQRRVEKGQYQNSANSGTVLGGLGNLFRSWRTTMFRSSSPGLFEDPQVQQFLSRLAGDLFGDARSPSELDFATLERHAHEAGREIARRLCEQITLEQARSVTQSQPCPDCHQSCSGSLERRELLTRDGPIQLDEAKHYCPHCRRVFFPQPSGPTPQSPPVQPSRPDDRSLCGYRDALIPGGHQAVGHHQRVADLPAPPSDALSGSRRRTRR